jgi:hypothetical protein
MLTSNTGQPQTIYRTIVHLKLEISQVILGGLFAPAQVDCNAARQDADKFTADFFAGFLPGLDIWLWWWAG